MPVLSVNSLYASLGVFADRINSVLETVGLDLTCYQADHIALRVNDHELASHLHQQWREQGEELSVNNINGRPIAVMKINPPLQLGCWDIFCVELPYPNEKIYAEQGWEHVEWVIPSNAVTVDDFLADVLRRFPLLKSRWNRLEQIGVTVKLSAPKGERERLANPTVAFKANGVCIKLHPVSLEAVIESEQRNV